MGDKKILKEEILNKIEKEENIPMRKETKIFIGTIAGALVGSAILNLIEIDSLQLANLFTLIGLISGGVIGYYVARNN